MDGVPSEWVPADRFADMTDGGYSDRQIRATLYLHYDCATDVLFAYVRAFGDGLLKRDRPENAYLRIDGAGKLVGGLSGDDGTPPDFVWVGIDGAHARGWEASGVIAPGRYTLRAHVLLEWDDADGYLPLDTVPRTTNLVLDCDDDDATSKPTPRPTPTPAPSAKPKPTPARTPAPVATPTPKPSRDDKDQDKDADGDKDNGKADKDKDGDTDKDGKEKDKDKDKDKDGKNGDKDKDSGTPNGGIILVLPLLAGTMAWSTRPERLRRRRRAD